MPPHKSPKTERDHEVDNILRQADARGWEMAYGFWHAPEIPPITPDSLAELDMPRIINNPKLRHDVNFDRELHFRPNLDGSKGKQKIESAEMYWRALEGELVLCGHVHAQKMSANYGEKEEYWQGILTASLRRLPMVFKAIGDILKTLVPDYDQQAIGDRLDVALIMREISHGVCDLVDLANWLNKVLKSHCAPMRDELVDRMKRDIIRGATEQKPAKLVSGLRQLLNILEAMKLDVANHQIRHMRSILVDNSVEFSKCYNAHRAGQGKIDLVSAKIWIEVARSNIQIASAEEVDPTYPEAMCSALIKSLLFPNYAQMYPTTFYLDVERLRALRTDMQTTIYFQICKDVLAQFCGRRVPPQQLAGAVNTLHMTVAAIVGPLAQFEENRENIAAEIMRIGLALEGRLDVTYDAGLLETLEDRLEMELRYGSVVYERYADILIARMVPKLTASVEHDIKLSALQLQDKHVPHLSNPVASHALAYGAVCTPGVRSLPTDPDNDFIRRFTHVVALHWQVWADICYLVPLEELEAASVPEGSSPPPSPTVPVAQAVYAPGHKWLPVGLTVTEVPSIMPSAAPTPRPQPQTQAKNSDGEQEAKSALDTKKQPQQSA